MCLKRDKGFSPLVKISLMADRKKQAMQKSLSVLDLLASVMWFSTLVEVEVYYAKAAKTFLGLKFQHE
jgi:hypothetical protein